jgi:hypothetical protein
MATIFIFKESQLLATKSVICVEQPELELQKMAVTMQLPMLQPIIIILHDSSSIITLANHAPCLAVTKLLIKNLVCLTENMHRSNTEQ